MPKKSHRSTKRISSSTKPELSVLLKALLVLNVLLSLYGLLTSFDPNVNKVTEMVMEHPIPGWYFISIPITNILSLLASYGIWKYKKWGVYLLGVTMVINLCIPLYVFPEFSIVTQIAATLIIALLWYFGIKSTWKYFSEELSF